LGFDVIQYYASTELLTRILARLALYLDPVCFIFGEAGMSDLL
jgi:hypothetical protein